MNPPCNQQFEHLKFLGDPPAPAALVAVPAKAKRRRQDEVSLGQDGAAFFEALCNAWGLTASRYRDSILLRRQNACLRALRATSPVSGAFLMSRDQRASERALGAVMIGVTEFFRDSAVFEALRPWVRALREDSVTLNALSIGCSDGSELYSLGILLAEEGMLDSSRLRGLDCRPTAIETARQGIYPATAVAGIDASRRANFFVPVARTGLSVQKVPRVRVAEEVRMACEWRVADAFSLAPEPDQPAMDIILCRNLAIYLKPDAATELWERCIACLRPGGLLITGKAERPPSGFRAALRRLGTCMYRRN
jgi:chemotaxis protein methyltransferase CheR